MTTNPFLARFADEPVLVAPEARGRFEACLHNLAASLDSEDFRAEQRAASAESDDAWWGEPGSFRSWLRPYVVKDGVLQIPVKGVLLHDFPYAFGSWATGYDYIWRAYQRGMGDYNVRGIALVIDSGGGQVAGCFDAVDRMYALKDKPVRAFAAEHAYSAAYAIASLADEIVVTRTGGVGSVGVVTSHMDVSGALEQYGYKITFIFAGKHKVDGNPYEALPEDVKARIQEKIDALYDVFVSTVARNREMDEQAVRDTEALTFTASQALSNGFADKIGALDDALADYSAALNSDEGDEPMAEITQADVDAARAAGVQEGTAAGAKAERTRITTILGSDAGKARPKAALSAALKTDMSAEEANAFLAELAEEKPEASKETITSGETPFDKTMSKDNPEVGDGDKGTQPEGANQLDSVRGLITGANLPGFTGKAAS